MIGPAIEPNRIVTCGRIYLNGNSMKGISTIEALIDLAVVSVGAPIKVVPAKTVGPLDEAGTSPLDNDPRMVCAHHGDSCNSSVRSVVNVHSTLDVMHIGDPAILATNN